MENGSFVDVQFQRDSLLVEFLAALYAHTDSIELKDFNKNKIASR
jgi:hypothetical protein